MSERIKNYVGIALIIGILLTAASVWNYSSAYSRQIEPSSFRSFSVTGEGEIVAVPDVAQFSFSVITEGGTNIANLQAENTTKVNSAIDFVKSNGVEDKDIKTQNYNLNPRYQYFSCPRPLAGEAAKPCPPAEIVGYTITQSVQVKIRDFTAIGAILSGVTGNGANTVSQLAFTIDDPTEVENQARAEAIEKAKTKAEAMAKAGGFSVGRLLSIQEGGGVIPYYSRAEESLDFMTGVAAQSAPAPAIEPGSQEVTITVTLRYEIR